MHKAVRAFKSNFVEARFTSLTVSLCVIVMRYVMFSRVGIPESPFPDTGFIWQFISGWFQHPWVSFISSTVSVFIIAALLSYINNRFSLIRTRSKLPFVVPLLLFSLHPYFLVMSPDYIAIGLMLYAFIPLLNSYQQNNTQLFSFRVSILVGLAALFQLYALLLLPLWWRGEYTMRGGHFKSFISSIFGLLLVFWSLFVVCFFVGDMQAFVSPFLHLFDISILHIPLLSLREWVSLVLLFLFFLLFMVMVFFTSVREKVLTIVTLRFMVLLLVFLLIFQAVYWSKTLFFLSLGGVFLSYLIAYFFSHATHKRTIYFAVGFLFLLLVVYLSHFG